MKYSSLFVSILLTSCTVAQTPRAEEPGAAQARQATTQRAITEFTHPAVETRGVWLPARDILVPREELVLKLDQLKSAGFNRVLICTQFRGYVLYPGSAFLPQTPELKGEDRLQFLVDECHKRGMKADAWQEYGMYAYFTATPAVDKSMGVILDANPEMISLDKDDNAAITRSFGTFYSYCPSHPKTHELLANLAVEVTTKYAVDSLNLDRIRFASWDHLSKFGRTRFQTETGIPFAAYDPKSKEGIALSEWKRQQTLAACRAISIAVRKSKPGLLVTSYVVPPDEKDDKSQSYDLWMRENLLDAIAVSMYGADIDDAARKAIAILDGKTDRLIAAVSSEQPTQRLTSNIERSRQLKLIGQYTWYAGSTDEADAAALKAGPYAMPSEEPSH